MPATIHPCEAALKTLPAKLLVGVSGGLDSTALLHALVATGRKPVVVHFDHGWRRESAGDARFVRDLAKKLGLKFIAGKMPARTPHREAAARAARYAFFSATARKLGLADLVLAHQADDQVETFLLQLLRGGGAGARGMDEISRRSGLVLHRPWLGLWRKEIAAYAKKNKLAWRNDATNADLNYRRNLIRRRIVPYLQKQLSPQVPENLFRAAEIFRAESEWLDHLCAEAAAGPELAVAVLRAAPLGQQRRTILRWLQRHEVADVGFADVEAVRGLLVSEYPAKINLSAGRHARRRAGKIFLSG